jgi:hypothetical protein
MYDTKFNHGWNVVEFRPTTQQALCRDPLERDTNLETANAVISEIGCEDFWRLLSILLLLDISFLLLAQLYQYGEKD